MTRVVAATADGKPKVILSYMLEALSSKESQMSEPWKSSDAREKMFLMKLSVFETPQQVAAFGWTTVQRDIIPPDQDRDFCTQPEFCVTWVRKVSSFRQARASCSGRRSRNLWIHTTCTRNGMERCRVWK